MNTEETLSGKTALVTGAARGIGRACALRLAQAGADVAVLDIDLTSYNEFEAESASMTSDSTVGEIRALGRRSVGVQVDLTSAESTRKAVEAVAGELGPIDIGVCIAGGGKGGFAETAASVVEMSTFHEVVERNLMATVHTCQALVASMSPVPGGRIITMSSLFGRKAEPDGGYAHYGASKAAIIMYSRYLARELGPRGITVNCLAPGYIHTGRLANAFAAEGSDELLSTVPLGRFGTAADCAGVVGFLSSEAAAYVTGTVIPIDGGVSA
ncbi:SDR family NAD(P)-dependent oxidoreductase [Rhodococcoides yunnanense]|uniref:SDR family NAD(P)-dependent oxidoreductase n=1 Tax=Rhodococcoides yunnanense TaxID=278209 RepID=UPI000933AB27|nr:SDR family NAD(P)-dependent oxidoreductase [Rhodococcus yunnanensis]